LGEAYTSSPFMTTTLWIFMNSKMKQNVHPGVSVNDFYRKVYMNVGWLWGCQGVQADQTDLHVSGDTVPLTWHYWFLLTETPFVSLTL
jgi:hypothetical protein